MEYNIIGSLEGSEWVGEEISLSATFLQPCSTVAWAGDIRDDQTFIVNTEVVDGYLPVKVYNPSAPARFWSMDNRLKWINLEYRKKGDVAWTVAKNDELDPADFKELESSFG